MCSNAEALLPVVIGCLVPITIGIYTDYTKNMLYDVITLPILLFGLVYAGTIGNLLEALIGAGSLFAVYFILALLIGGVGGGDIKLAAGIGAWFGLWGGFPIMLIASVLALICGLLKLAIKGQLAEKVQYWLNGVYIYTLYGELTVKPKQLPEEGEELPADAVPFGIYMGIAVWSWCLYIYQPWQILKCLIS